MAKTQGKLAQSKADSMISADKKKFAQDKTLSKSKSALDAQSKAVKQFDKSTKNGVTTKVAVKKFNTSIDSVRKSMNTKGK